MKNFSKKVVLGLSLLSTGICLWGQQQPVSHKVSPSKGHALYKQTKIYDSQNGARVSKPHSVGDKAEDRFRYDFERFRNPITGKIPENIQVLEGKFSKQILETQDIKKTITQKSLQQNGDFSYWENRGPYNVGGRTRALAIDASNENVILAGGVSGGLWRSEDSGESWTKMTQRQQSPSITCIVQDTTSLGKKTWYYGSGEFRGNSASEFGAFYQGTGVYKSVDGGRTWKLLKDTTDNDVIKMSSFDIINSLAIHPITGDLYVATMDGIYRSQNGGENFDVVLFGGDQSIAEVAISPSGRIYGTLAITAAEKQGFFTSLDGDEWEEITPPWLPRNFGRTVIGIDPSQDNNVYFFSNNTGYGIAAFLNRYNANDENLDTAWTFLSTSLPTQLSGNAANLNLQGGYNMLIKVHPTNSNVVFVGGTNLYRSTDAFATQVKQESWIAGYSPLSSSYDLYTNQHPDQHALVFYPSNPNKVLSGNDGGVFVTENILETQEGEPVAWNSLNNGYITTQAYGVSFDPEANSDDLVAGFQDNGTWYTNSTDAKTPWTEEYSGDGTISAIADGGNTRYVSSQFGNIIRYDYDEEGNVTTFARVTPADVPYYRFSFVTPFVLDPNNDNIMYLPVGNTIWRNNNLDNLPKNTALPSSTGWVPQFNTFVRGNISALDVSTYPIANRLYFGTATGGVYRVDNANIDGQELIDLTTDKGLPTGFINDINVDPSDSDRVIITYSNYGIPSIFLTEDAGETWVNISGNLEEKKDGTGNGPSARSTAFLGSSKGATGSALQRVFVATSTGLYTTYVLRGENTRWYKEPFMIGNVVADEVKTRKDGFIALATHGNGLFSARLPMAQQMPESELKAMYTLEDFEIYENSEVTKIPIKGLFEHSSDATIDIEITNSNPAIVTATIENDVLRLEYAPNSPGKFVIGLVATSGKEQVSEGLTVSVVERILDEQAPQYLSGFIESQHFLDLDVVVQGADDFTIPKGYQWSIDRIKTRGGSRGFPALTNVSVQVYNDQEGKPGELIYEDRDITLESSRFDGNLNFKLNEEIQLSEGTYWLSVFINHPFAPRDYKWLWGYHNDGTGAEAQIKDSTDFLEKNATDWTPLSTVIEKPFSALDFQMFGEIAAIGVGEAQAQKEQSLTTVKMQMNPMIWPNPSTNNFHVNISSLKLSSNALIQVYDITGKLIFQDHIENKSTTYDWNASDAKSGFYLVTISSDDSPKYSFKVLKK